MKTIHNHGHCCYYHLNYHGHWSNNYNTWKFNEITTGPIKGRPNLNPFCSCFAPCFQLFAPRCQVRLYAITIYAPYVTEIAQRSVLNFLLSCSFYLVTSLLLSLSHSWTSACRGDVCMNFNWPIVSASNKNVCCVYLQNAMQCVCVRVWLPVRV